MTAVCDEAKRPEPDDKREIGATVPGGSAQGNTQGNAGGAQGDQEAEKRQAAEDAAAQKRADAIDAIEKILVGFGKAQDAALRQAAEVVDLTTEEADRKDDPAPEGRLSEITENLALSEALKPVATATEELFSNDPAKVTARNAIEAAYRKTAAQAAPGTPAGELRVKYEQVDKKFLLAATDMTESLKTWIKTWLGPDPKPLKPSLKLLLDTRFQVENRLRSRAGPRERERDTASVAAKKWQQAYANWAKPGDTISALISEYADKIDKLNADINTKKNADLAIYTFWFEVAPKHLQLKEKVAPNAGVAVPGSDLIKKALKDYPEFANAFEPGGDRPDGSIFLIDPAKLSEHRETVLASWRSAAEKQAKCEAAFKLRPDDAAALKARLDQLIQGRAAAAKALLEDPAA